MDYPIALHEAFEAAVEDPETALAYVPIYRCFMATGVDFFRVPNWIEDIAADRAWGLQLEFCPWTGEPLPPDLGYYRDHVIDHEHNVPWWGTTGFEGRLPEEMYSDKWWRTRSPIDPKWYERPLRTEMDELWPPGLEDDPFIPWVAPSYPGRTRFPERPPHLCWHMDFLMRPYTLYAYLPWAREYGFRIVDINNPLEFQPMRVCAVIHCPFCGRKLPSNLREEWTKRVKAHGLTPADSTPEERAALPPELVSDTWWKEAGL